MISSKVEHWTDNPKTMERYHYHLPNYLKGINMLLYLTLILKYWQYIVIALCSIVIVALLIRCNILDERNISLKKEHELQLNTIVITNQAKAIELLKQQNETEKRISEVSELYEKQLKDVCMNNHTLV